MKPTVSIIIANFNYGRFTAAAIESALNQSWPAIDVIFIDDGSSDNSLNVAGQYDITILAQENQGVSAARNNAAQHARGDYILFLDSDDELYPDSIARLVEALERGGAHAGFAYGPLQYFGQRDSIFPSHPFDPALLARENYIQTSALIRKDVFDKVGGFDRGFPLREDWELFVRIWNAGYRGEFIEKPHLRYRKHKAPTRKKTRVPKRIAITRLEYLYPRFFIRQILRHPLRHLYYRWRYRIGPDIRHYGPSAQPPRVLRRAGDAEATT